MRTTEPSLHGLLFIILLLQYVWSAHAINVNQCSRILDNDIFALTCPPSAKIDSPKVPATKAPVCKLPSLGPQDDVVGRPSLARPFKPSIDKPRSVTTSSKRLDQTPRPMSMRFDLQLPSNGSHVIIPVDSVEGMQVDAVNRKELSGIDAQQPGKLFLSFGEWKRMKLGQREEHQRGQAVRDTSRPPQMIDSIDGVFSDDFGAMFEELSDKTTDTVYNEGEYITPNQSPGTKSDEDQAAKKTASPLIKTLKERSNYASTDCAATVRAANKGAKRSHSILYESKDQYMLNKCSAEKYVIIRLCEEIRIDTIVLANFEFFSSTFKDFRVYIADQYPTDEWQFFGQWQARNTRDLQASYLPFFS